MNDETTPAIEPGAQIGTYEILARLGEGGMGEVYRARDLNLGREVALKVLRREFSRDEERLGRFEREARSASALNHPNLVHIYQVGQDGAHHFIAMELVEGRTLRRVVEEEAPLNVEKALGFAAQVAKGLQKAHEAGIVHRDLKPENIMLSGDGYLKVLDFGLAKLADSPFDVDADSETATMHRAATQDGMLIGTVEYMSPEQASGKPADSRSDLFSLGIMLYEMLTGRLPFHRETMAQTLAAIIEKSPDPATKHNPSCPVAVEAFVHELLSKNPQDRPLQAADVIERLVSLASGLAPRPPSPSPPPIPPPSTASPQRPIVPRAISYRSAPAAVGPRRDQPETYEVQTKRGVKTMTAGRLRRHLRKEHYSGLEMVRREGSQSWAPLYETALFRDEVPHRGEPLAWARRRELNGYFGHLASFVGVGLFFYLQSGQVPFWMAFWGIGLFAHTARMVTQGILSPKMLRIGQAEGSALAEPEGDRRALGEAPEILDAGFLDEVEKVRALVERRDDSVELLRGIDAIVERMRDIAAKQQDLRDQTDAEEKKRLVASEAAIETTLNGVQSESERRLVSKQLAVVRSRLTAIDKAERVLAHLQIRREVAEHQVKNLRLDLSRAEASRAMVPELTSRLEDIRHEVDALEDVAAELGAEEV